MREVEKYSKVCELLGYKFTKYCRVNDDLVIFTKYDDDLDFIKIYSNKERGRITRFYYPKHDIFTNKDRFFERYKEYFRKVNIQRI